MMNTAMEDYPMANFYCCDRCPSYCCSYPRIPVKAADIKRLARHLGMTSEAAALKFTKEGEEPGEIILRHQPDRIYGTICRFIDLETRRCTVYEARPAICRTYPGNSRCGYYDFLAFERRVQEDPEFIPSTFNRPAKKGSL
ncbi:MAG TPA: YkgJ family cysteine cluster protein [Thermoanaerobaculia bacterium]